MNVSTPAYIYAVRTTGIACRPGCPSRTPHPRNVEYFDDFEAAQRAGYRACKRCSPDRSDPSEEWRAAIERACALMASDDSMSIDDVAAASGFSRFHFQRVFRSITGTTPAAYRRTLRDRYDSISLRGERLRYASTSCALGRVLVAVSERGIVAIELGKSDDETLAHLRRHFPHAKLERAEGELQSAVADVVALIREPATGAQLDLDIRGTAFQRRVWDALRRVPPGERVTYAQLAAAAGTPGAAQAAGAACGANRLAVAIPCHRAVRTGGELAGYRWGVERKAALLEEEERQCRNSDSGKADRASSSTMKTARSSTIRAS